MAATVVQGNADATATTGTSFGFGFLSAPTSGNLLVMFYGARDNGSNGVPQFTLPEGWTEVGVAAPMEFHTFGIAWRTSDGSESGTQTVTYDRTCNSRWLGLVEFNLSGVSDWALDASSFDGSGATNVASIASGSTGALSSAAGVAAVGGTSRTNTEDLSTDTGTSLVGEDVDFERDAGSANFIAAWLSLTATTALDATISEAGGSSRMGAGVAVFVEAAAGGQTITVARATEADAARGVTVDNPRTHTVARAVEIDVARPVTIDQPGFGTPTGLTSTAKTDTTVDLAWDAVPDASGYDVERDSVVIASDVAVTSFQDTGLDPATQYSYRVRAVK